MRKKSTKILLIFILLTYLLLTSCDNNENFKPDTEPPQILITYPPDNMEVVSGVLLPIRADADDNEIVEHMNFYIDDVLSFTDNAAPYEYVWDTSNYSNLHSIYVEVFDNSNNYTSSEVVSVNFVDSGEQPDQPTNPFPANYSISVPRNINLSWICSDPEDNPLNYDIYLSADPEITDEDLINENHLANTLMLSNLMFETTYYWKIIASDGINTTESEIWEFTTIYYNTEHNFYWHSIPAGNFLYGSTNIIQNIPYDYQIMKYEVTNCQYLTYLEEALSLGEISVNDNTVEGYYPGDEIYGEGVRIFYYLGVPEDYNFARISYENGGFQINVPDDYNLSAFINHPVVYVTWFGAWAFAEHYGFSLPTGLEWERAARGNTGDNYPWGNSTGSNYSNFLNSGDPWDNGTTPIGMYDGQTFQGYNTHDNSSTFDIYDLAGNVWEWTDSWWDYDNCYRMLRGGSWNYTFYNMISWSGLCYNPNYGDFDIGFRCVLR